MYKNTLYFFLVSRNKHKNTIAKKKQITLDTNIKTCSIKVSVIQVQL